MIVDFRDYKDITFSKYKRVFLFGCSFTNYIWPTWGNIIGYEAPNALVYNLGQQGGGNLYITERIIACNQKFKFNKDDLIAIMWSTHFREDRYIKNGWTTPGNIYSQTFYDQNFLEKYACNKGFVVRDLALITLVKNFLNSIPSDSIMLKAVDIEYKNQYIFFVEDSIEEVIKLYQDVLNDMGVPLANFVNDPNNIVNNVRTSKPFCPSLGWYIGHTYYIQENFWKKRLLYDYHPNPKMYLEFLTKIGFNISDKTKEKVLKLNKELLSFTESRQIEKWFQNLCKDTETYFRYVNLF
jgi:hypothetical protein